MSKFVNTILIICAFSSVFADEASKDVQDWTDPKNFKCAIHGNVLTKIEVPILWGLPAKPDRGYSMQEQAKLFPYSYTVAYGGCCVPEGYAKQKRAYIYRCEACFNGFHEWLTNNHPLPKYKRPFAPTNNPIYRQALRQIAEQDGAEQPATAPESKPEGKVKSQPEAEGRSR